MKTESAFGDFSFDFWYRTFKSLGWPVKQEILDTDALKEQGALPSGFAPTKITQLYFGKFIEVVIVEAEKITRSTCTRIARLWRQKRLTRPILVFTDGTQSYVVITPGRTSEQEVRILWIAEKLYHTDQEVINMMKYLEDENRLRMAYDSEFLPYEKVREEFFEGYRSLYQKMSKEMKKHLNSNASSYTQRFLGRLMFLYFLQRKGWLKGDKQFINKISNYKELNRLFYESLNTGSTEGIPFLNGSLFEKEEYMSEEMENKLSTFMDRFFIEARDFFNRFNFTVDESSPLEVEVSIDPALMGTVFENMLPENERGSKGTFYTPVAEISFICRRAIANYLGLRDEIRDDKFIDGLSKYMEELAGRKSEREIREFKDKLLSLKILDPAVGSGGFLVVMMQEIIRLLQEADGIVGWKEDTEEYKKRILNNLYGFDIEPEAVEIARLRLWLSLIIDQKEPEPLPNLDLRIVDIEDSLTKASDQTSIDPEIENLRFQLMALHERYTNEHNAVNKRKMKKLIDEISNKISKMTGTDPNVIENYMPSKADVIIMNPPYVRQEKIDKKKKEYYVETYKLDKTSDLYSYFLIRALSLMSEKGIAVVICSDKWLEAGYGESIQEKLKNNLIAVYGQKMRTFGADVNTAIVVYSSTKREDKVQFVLLESYSNDKVMHCISFDRTLLKPGKWFYLKPGAKFFIEKILPKLDHKLSDFAEIKRGFTTGANEFFYMKDISHLYEADYLANPKKFAQIGVTAKTKGELKQQGLIYIENEGGYRFVIDKKDVKPLVRSPKEIQGYQISKPTKLCLYTEYPGEFTMKYIRWGESVEVEVRGKERKVWGYNSLETTKNRNPWYKLTDLKPTRILLPMFYMERFFVPMSSEPVICDHTLYTLYCENQEKLWLYLNSTIFFMVVELFCRRLGGGGAALEMMVEDYNEIPVPNLTNLNVEFDSTILLKRKPLSYFEEIKQKDTKELDIAVLRALGFDRPEEIIEELYHWFVQAVEDRLIKGSRGLKNKQVVET